jgi:transcriptional regulator with XRE-family HTH domain
MATMTQGRRATGSPLASGTRPVPDRAQRAAHTAGGSLPGDFGATLRRYRRCVGWSQNALARVVGLDASYINRLERGEREAPTRQTALALAQALELSTEDADRLLGSAGYLPLSLQKLGAADATVNAVVRLLTDDRLSPELRADFRAVVETIAYRWQYRHRVEAAHAARPASPGQVPASTAVTATAATEPHGVAATRCSQVAIRPNSVASLPVTGVGLAR